MANIINLTIIYDSTATISGANPIDLNCGTPEVNKVITAGIYDISQNPPVKLTGFLNSDTQLLTKIENCDGSYYLVKETYGFIADFIKSLCGACTQNNGGNGLTVDLTGIQNTLNQIEINTENLTPEESETFIITDFTKTAVVGGFEYLLLQSAIGITLINSVTEKTGMFSLVYSITPTNDVLITSTIEYPIDTKIRISGQA